MALIEKLTAIGEAIRAKTGKSDLLTLEQMPVEIASIESGSGGNSGGNGSPVLVETVVNLQTSVSITVT